MGWLSKEKFSNKEVILSQNKYESVYFVSVDQFIVKTPGQFPCGYVQEGSDSCFNGGKIYDDSVYGVIWIYK